MATFLGITSGRNWSTEMPVGGETGCACKGVRFCAACKDSERVSKLVKNGLDYYIDYKKYVYAAAHGVAVLDHLLPQYPDLDNVLSAAKRVNEGIASNDVIAVPGLHVVLDFLALNEEVKLVEEIDRKEWVMSQSGRRKQDYGPQVNFKRKKIKMDRFVGMPHYVDYLLKKMSLIKRDVFGDYHPYELCNLEYDSSRMSAIEMHHDDCWIWGNRLICLNLLGEAVLTFVNEDKRLLVYVPLPRRTLVCMTGEIRYSWKHGVLPEHIRNRRIALTMRESSDAFKEGGDLYEKYGRELTRLGKIRVHQEWDMEDTSSCPSNDANNDNDEEENIKKARMIANARAVACRKYITGTLLPTFRNIITYTQSLPYTSHPYAFYEALSSLSIVMKEKVIEFAEDNHEFASQLTPRIFRFARTVFFKLDMKPAVAALISGIFRTSFIHYDAMDAFCDDRKTNVINQTSRLVQLLYSEDGFDMGIDLEYILLETTKDIIADMLECECRKPFRSSLYRRLYSKQTQFVTWASSIGFDTVKMNYDSRRVIFIFEKGVIYHLTKQIYNLVIVEYPESGELIDDLACCIRNDGQARMDLVNTLSAEVQSKLLHIGVGTTEILEGYARAVECLRRLDPSCVIMQKICSEIRHYIKQRPDTVRCIITYITGDKREELSEQLTKHRAAIVDEDDLMGVNDELIPGPDDSDDCDWREWLPDPPDANTRQSRRFRQNADVFNMLVSVYGSKELFVKEYRELLAERLTKSWKNRDPNFEQRYLDLLKLRFTEGDLQQCEVMLKDMRDSERMDRLVNSALPFPISARIISSFFWPKIENETLKVPNELMDGLTIYGRGFETHKGSRKLDWMTGIGSFEMNLELDGVEASIAVSPAHAAVLMPFTRKEIWSTDEMALELGMDKRSVKKRLEWWQNNGVVYVVAKNVEDDNESWHLSSGSTKIDRLRSGHEVEEEDSDDERNEDTAAVDALEQYWSYTLSFIANQEPVKADRLHTIFRMFASPGQQGPTLEDVISFLQRKVKQNFLTCTNGLYKVVKDPVAH